MFDSLNISYNSYLYIFHHVSFSCFAPKIHRSTFHSKRLTRRSFVSDTFHVSEVYVSTGLISTLYINILVFFKVKWDLRYFPSPKKNTCLLLEYVFGVQILCEIILYTYLSYCQTQYINPLKPELNPICYLLALLGAHHFLHVSRIRVKLLTLMWLMSYIYGAPILDVSRSHTTTQHSR